MAGSFGCILPGVGVHRSTEYHAHGNMLRSHFRIILFVPVATKTWMCKLRGRCGGTRDGRREVTCGPGPGRAPTFSSRRLHHHEDLPSNTPTPQPSTHPTVRRPFPSFLCAASPSGRSSCFCVLRLRSIAALAAPQPSLRPTPVHGPQPQWTTPEIPALGLRCPTLVAHSVWEYVAPGSPSAGRPAPCEKK